MFKKLDIHFDNIDPLELMGAQTWDAADQGLLFEYEIDRNRVSSIIKDRIKFNIEPYNINLTKIVSPGAPAHSDYYTVALNIYLTAGTGDVTNFWKQNENEVGEYLEGPYVYKMDMECLGSFIANKGDAYLLDTSIIHSVAMKENSEPRYLIRFAWHGKSYQEIEQSIEIL